MSVGDEILLDFHRLAGFGAEIGINLVPHGLLILRRNAQQHVDDTPRHLGSEIRNDVEILGPNQRIEAAATQPSDLGLECGDSNRENTLDISRRSMVWTGGSSKIRTPEGIGISAQMSPIIPSLPEIKVLLSR